MWVSAEVGHQVNILWIFTLCINRLPVWVLWRAFQKIDEFSLHRLPNCESRLTLFSRDCLRPLEMNWRRRLIIKFLCCRMMTKFSLGFFQYFRTQSFKLINIKTLNAFLHWSYHFLPNVTCTSYIIRVHSVGYGFMQA